MFLLSFIFVKACGRLSRRESLHVFTLFVYICIAVGDSLFKRGRVMVPLIRLTPLHCFVLPTRTCISIGKWREWRRFFYILWVRVRADCSLCLYWWNCWASLFKLSFRSEDFKSNEERRATIKVLLRYSYVQLSFFSCYFDIFFRALYPRNRIVIWVMSSSVTHCWLQSYKPYAIVMTVEYQIMISRALMTMNLDVQSVNIISPLSLSSGHGEVYAIQDYICMC